MCFWLYLAHFFLELEIFQTNVVEKIKTHTLYSITLFENRAFCEIMWKNLVEPARRQMKIWGMRIACWLQKHVICNNYCFSIATFVVITRLNVTIFAHCPVNICF